VAVFKAGRNWLDRNIGATAVATVAEATAAAGQKMPSYGDYYEFSKLSAADICPLGFSVPTDGELAADTITLPDATKVNSVATALSSFLKLPAAGGLNGANKDKPNNVGSEVYLWTKTVDRMDVKKGYYWIAEGGTARLDSAILAHKFPVRCIQTEEPILFNGVSYNMITSPNTGRIWLDRNLGATKVADSKDAADTDAYGDLYQWGRRKDGHEDRENTSIDSSNLASSITTPASWDFKETRERFRTITNTRFIYLIL
jgi:hypothetical protein